VSFGKTMDIEKFWSNIDRLLHRKCIKSSEKITCWHWRGAFDKDGYGRQRVLWPDGSVSVESAHRLSYMRQNNLFKYSIPRMDDNGHLLDISHICHNKSCINSKHLVLEQHAINQDREHYRAQGRCSGCHRPFCVI
jgi:hypothetical protein